MKGMACVLCASLDDPTEEDVIPKWLLRAFGARGGVTLTASEEAGDPHEVRTLKHFQVTLDRGLCRRCNNQLLGRLEQEVRPVLEPMAVRCEPTILDLAKQRLLAVWAIKTVYLMELAVLQRYPTMRLVGGYQPSTSEMGWLLAELERRSANPVEPPPRSMVWLACWDFRSPSAVNQGSLVNYAPSLAPLPAADGSEVVGQFSTLAVGFAVFQVFTVDYVEADVREATAWNPGPPASIAGAIRLIWPHRTRASDVAWPPPAFPKDSFDRLVNWDLALRRGVS
jgi:hypothetical protein